MKFHSMMMPAARDFVMKNHSPPSLMPALTSRNGIIMNLVLTWRCRSIPPPLDAYCRCLYHRCKIV